jgi:sugar O-acyltransferase (sialic acid O-acetyltransferase NeuD family)
MAPVPGILVYGASGHGKVVAEVVRSMGLELDGFLDDGVAAGSPVLGAAVLGGFSWLQPGVARVIAPAIGGNLARERVCARLREAGHTLGVFVHERAWVSPSATLGPGTVVMAGAIVNAEARVGQGVIINTGAIVEHECVLGDYVHLSPGAALGGGVTVGTRSHVGLGASVKQLARIGSDCVIGAGAVVLRFVEDGRVVAGVPARPLR